MNKEKTNDLAQFIVMLIMDACKDLRHETLIRHKLTKIGIEALNLETLSCCISHCTEIINDRIRKYNNNLDEDAEQTSGPLPPMTYESLDIVSLFLCIKKALQKIKLSRLKNGESHERTMKEIEATDALNRKVISKLTCTMNKEILDTIRP